MDLPAKQSAFLWGSRQTGKTAYLESHFPNSLHISLLQSDIFLAYSKAPNLLREQVISLPKEKLKHPIIIDEIQKVPHMLDEVHWLIENTEAHFILCGSSARKLKRQGTNLLGGRAWKYHFFPLVSPEVRDLDLLKVFNNGLVPSHYLSTNPSKSLKSYVEDYLTQEIKEEGLVRNLPSFARFLDSMAFSNGEMIKYSNIASDCGVNSKTVQNYFQILVDTLLGNYLLPYRKKVGREIISETPKFYLFDIGVANYLSQVTVNILKGTQAGKSLEHFIFMELNAYKHFYDKREEITYWRTKTGLEVDFILGKGKVAIAVKIKTLVERSDIKGLIAFCNEHQPEQALVVSQDNRPRTITLNNGCNIHIMPWRTFLQNLWSHTLF